MSKADDNDADAYIADAIAEINSDGDYEQDEVDKVCSPLLN